MRVRKAINGEWIFTPETSDEEKNLQEAAMRVAEANKPVRNKDADEPPPKPRFKL